MLFFDFFFVFLQLLESRPDPFTKTFKTHTVDDVMCPHLNFNLLLQMQPIFAISMQANGIQNANPLARTLMTIQKKVPRNSIVGSVIKYPNEKVIAAHGLFRLFTSKKLAVVTNDDGSDKYLENPETVLTFEPDVFVAVVTKIMEKYPTIPLFRFENDEVT